MSAYTIRQLRAAAPAEFRELDDDELVREYARVKQIPFEQAADYYGVKPSGTAAETVRQIGAGFAVDLPRMVGQGLKYTGLAPQLGQELVTSADERAYGWQPDLRGRGLVGEALVTGGRAIGPMAPAIAAAFVPGGQVVAPTVAAGLFGTSSAQETYEKLRGQGISEEDAQAAAARVGLIQGPLEGVATYTGLKAFSAARPLLGLGATTSQVAGSMTTGNALKSFGKAFGTNLLVQPGTEVIQDTATEGVERAYGAAPEDLGEIARSSALAGVGLTLLLGPLSIGGHVGRARRAEELKAALYDPNTPTEVRAQAMDMVMAEATRQKVAPQDIDTWFESQLELEDARNAELARLAEIRGESERNLLIDETLTPLAPLQQRIDLAQGLTRTPQRDYESQFTAADQEPSGQFVQDPKTGIERELTMGEYYAQLQGLEPAAAPTAADAPAATPTAAPAAAGDPRRQILRDTYGIVPTKPALQLVDAIEAEGLALDSPVVAGVINFAAEKPLSSKRLEKAVEMLDKAIIESRKAPSVSTTTPVRPTAPVAPAQAAAPVVAVDGQAPAVNAPAVAAAPVAPVAQAVTPSGKASDVILNLVSGGIKDASADERKLTRRMVDKIVDDGLAAGNTNEQILDRVDRSTDGKLTGAAVVELDRYMNARREAPAPAAPAAEQTAPDILNLVFGEQDADIVRAALSGQSAQQIADDLAARGVTGRSRSMIANKIAGEKAVREQWPRKIAEAKQRYNLTDAQIEEALRAATAPDADTRSEVEREMGLGFARATIAAPMSETEAVEAGLENVVGTVGGSTSAVQGFTDLQKKVDAVLDQIEKTTDPQVLAALQARLAELAVEVKAVERREQARVRTEAGKETEIAADTEAELEAPVERAAPKKAEAAPEKAEGEAKAKGKKKSKEEKEAEAEELSAEGKAARAAADAKLAAESAAKRAADRKGLVVGDTVMNPKLGTGVVKSFAGDGDATTVTVDFQSGQTKELSVKLAKLEKTDAVQKPSATKVSVRDRAEAGQEVGEGDAQGRQAPAEGQARQKPTAEQVETRRADTLRKGQLVLAGKQWATYADTKTQGKWADLTPAQQEKWRVAVVDNRNPSMALANEIAAEGQAGVRVRASTDREAAYVGATTTVDFGNGTVAMVSPSSRDVFIRVGNSNASPIRVRDTRSGNISSVSAMPESVPQSLRQPLFDLAVLMEADAPASEILAAQAKVERAVKALNAKGDGQVELGEDLSNNIQWEQAPELREREGGRVLELVVNGESKRTFELVSPGLWNAFKGDARDNLLRSAAPQKKQAEAQQALEKAQDDHKERGPLNRVEESVLSDLQRGDIDGLTQRAQSVLDGGQLRESFVRMLSHAVFRTDKVFKPATEQVSDPMARTNMARLAPDWMLGKADRPAQPAAQDAQPTGRAPGMRGKAATDAVTDRGDAPTGGEVEEAGAYTAAELTADIKDFMRVDTLGKSVIIVDKPTDLEDLRDIAIGLTNVRSFGWTRDGKAVLIASRIRKGTGRAKFMHEVGSHLGMQRLLPPEMFNRLVDQVLTWAARTDNSLETRLAKAAVGRVPENTNPASVRNEIAAYFVEEATLAGVNPTAARQLSGPVAKWMRSLFDAMKRALTKLGVKVETLTARDVVNLAYGAASLRLESDGVAPRGTELELGVQVGPDTAAFKRWFKDSKVVDADGEPLVVYHGTNKSFVTFDIRRSGSASGQYFGQGFYFARSPGVADAFKGEGGDGPRIMSVYLAVSQPFYTNTTDLSDAQLTALRNNEQLGDALKKAEAEAAGAPFSSWYTLQRAAVLSGKRSTYIRDALESLGFDGIITDSLTEGSTAQSDAEIIVFRPEQIKSATNNRGTYDPADPNIEFGMEPLKKPTTSTVEKNINKLLPPVARKPVRGTLASISRQSSKALDYVVFTSDLINRAVDVGVKSAKQFGDLLAARATKAREMERDVERIADLYTLVPESDRGTGPNSVNQFIFDSTREGKWGYDTATRKADPEMKVRFDNLKPESQNLVRAMFDHGDKMLALKKKTVLDTTASEYDALIAASKAAGDTVTEARQIKEKADTLKRFKSLFAIREGIPYAPIKRTGDHVVVAKSAEYVAAEKEKNTKLIEKLQADSDHYHVSFTDTAAQARTLREQLEDQGAFAGGSVDNFERETKSDVLYAGESTLKALTALRNKAEAGASEGDKSSAKLLSIISQLYLEALADGSARKSEMKRRGVAGEVDMLSSFALQGRADANFLASLEFNPQVQDTLQKMRDERDLGGNRDRKSQLFNELAKRYEGSLETPNNPWLDKLTRTSSIYFLATSPAYYLQNLTQPFMMSLPAMAGRHDYGKSSAELVKAYGQLSDVIKSVKLGNQLQQQWDFSKVPTDVREAIMTLADRGRIDIGLDTELGEFRVEGESAFAARWNKIDKALRTMVQKGEAINRLSTAMAAYRLELAKTKSPEAALDYADRILQETHGDYSRFNAPRAFNTPVGKVALQFRKFQLIQLTFYAKLINDALTGKDRAVALKTLGYALGHTAVLAGTMGLPGYAAISWALGSILGSDDEEFDLTDELRKAIGDEDLANMILRGAPTVAGMDISGKVGAGTMLSILPFSNADLTTRSGQLEAAGAVLTGASGGMIVRGLDGAQLMLSGDFYKGLELLMPKGVSDAMKSYRIADEGMTRRNGDVILPPDEVNSLDAVFQALGIAPVKQTVVYEKRQRFQDMTSNFTDRTTRVKNNYVAAMRKGDTAAAAEAREAWKNLQDAKVKNGLKRSPLSDLLKAPREQQKRERNTRDGIQFNRSTQRAAEEIAER